MIKSNLFKKSCVAVSLFSYLVSSTFAAIPTMTVEYDAAGNVSKQTAGNGQAHSYGYDIAGNVTSYSSPGVGSASFEYGPESLSKFTDFKGLNTTYQMDKLTGQIESITSPDTGTTSFTYDQAGNVISALTPAGVTFSFTYDALNRATSASFGDETINYSYYSYGTAKGELASIQDSTGSTGFNYNAQGLPLSKTQTTTGVGGGSGASLGYLKTWVAGQLSSLRYPSGKTISYTYDAERITSISLNGAVIISNITYSANGAPVSWQMGGTGTYSRSYDSYGRMVSYSIDGTAKAVGWDENNRVSSIDYASGTSSFGYDAADRLTSASGGPHAGAGYAYDANGNKTSVTVAGANYGATVDPSSNRILTFTAPGVARSYSYDNKGNTVGDGTRTYSWSNTNKLLSATNGTTTAYYGYNGFGQRVKKVVGQAARYYFYDDDGYSLLGEYFQTTPGAPVGTVYETVYLEGIPVAVLKGSSVYYIQPDHLNTPRIIRDASGVLVWKWDSDLYGKGLANQNPGGVSLFEFNIRFPGQVFDSETGLHYNMARYYDPEIGRYTSSDPIGLGGGINTYEYVAGNPLKSVDALGLVTIFIGGGADTITKNVKSYQETYFKEAKYFDWTQIVDIVKLVVETKKINPCEPVYLVGHSLGAAAGAISSDELAQKGITIDLLITVDPVGFPFNKEKVKGKAINWINFNAAPVIEDYTDYIAKIGGKWNEWPKNKANEHYVVNYNHRDFQEMMQFKIRENECAQSLLNNTYSNKCKK